MAKFNHGEECIYIGFKGKPNEYRRQAIYVAPDPISETGHIIRIKRQRGSGWMLSTVKLESIEKS